MYFQIRKHYEYITNSNIINDLINKNVSLQKQGINQIAYLLYGETSLVAINLYKIIKKEEKSFIQRSEEFYNLINSIEKRLIARLVDFYNHYFIATGRSNGLIEDLKLELEDSPVFPKLVKLISDDSLQ